MIENCPHCGKSRFGDDKVCWFCGKSIESTVSDVSEKKESGNLKFESDSSYSSYKQSTDNTTGNSFSWPGENGTLDKTADPEPAHIAEFPEHNAPPSIVKKGSQEPPPAKKGYEPPPPPVVKISKPAPPPVPPTPEKSGNPASAIFIVIGIFIGLSVIIAVAQKGNKSRPQKVAKKEQAKNRIKKILEKRKAKAVEEKKALTENTSVSRLDEHIKKCTKNADRTSCRRALMQLKSMVRTPSTSQKILNVARIGCKKGYWDSCIELCDEARKRDKFTAEDKDYYCSYGCETARRTDICEQLAYAKLRGEGHTLSESAAKRHVTGLCRNFSVGCWNEGEIAEIVAWNMFEEKTPRNPSVEDIWIGPAMLKNQAKGFSELFKTEKSRETHLKGIKVLSTYFRELQQKKSINRAKDPEKPARYEQIHFYLHNGSCTDAVVNLTFEWVLKGKNTVKTLKKQKVCYKGATGEMCQHYNIAEGKDPVSEISVKLPANVSTLVSIEMDSNFTGSEGALYKKVRIIDKKILWPRGKVCPKPDLKALLSLNGPFKFIADIFKKGCDLNKAKQPDYMICKYMKKIGSHSKEDLRKMCNNRNTNPSGYIEGACRRLKARFKEEIKDDKTSEISEPSFEVAPSGTGYAFSSNSSVKIGTSTITIMGSKTITVNGKTGKEAEKELKKMLKGKNIKINKNGQAIITD